MAGDRLIRTQVDDQPCCVSIFGSGGYEIDVGREVVIFDWSDRFGPLPLKKNGGGRDLRHNHPFWRAASLWSLQGKRLDGKKAIWHEPKKPVLKMAEIPGKRGLHPLIVEHGEEGWDW